MNFKNLQPQSLKTRVTIFSLGIFLISIWSLAFYASRMLRTDMIKLLSEQQVSTVAFAAASIDDEIRDRMNALQTVAGRITPEMHANTPVLQAFLQERRTLPGMFNAGYFVTGMDGTAIADFPISSDRLGRNFSELDYMIMALKEGKTSIGKPVIGKALQTPAFSMATPIRDGQGHVIGALVGVTNLSASNFLDDIARNKYGSTGGYLLISRTHRMVVTATDKSRIMTKMPAPGISPVIDRAIAGEEFSAVYRNPVGVEVLGSSRMIPTADWFLGVTLPTAEAFAPVRALQKRVMMSAILISLLAGSLIWWVTRKALKQHLAPMLAASNALTASTETGLMPEPLPITRQDETGELFGSFNRLLESFKQRETALLELKESLKTQNKELRVTEEILRTQVKEYELSQKRFKESEERFKALSEATFGGIVIHDQGLILDCNQALADMTGFTVEELIGMNGLTLIAPCSLDLVLQHMKNGYDQRYEIEGIRKDGTVFPLSVRGKTIHYKGRAVRINEFRDITERKLHEQEQLKMEKLESLGVLAGGIAHDFNNILTGIMGNISLAQMFLDPASRSCQPLAEAEKASVRAAELAHQLLTFARGGEPVKKVISIQNLVNESVSLVLHGSNVKKTVDIPDAIHAIEADEGQMCQVLHNIFINATQAMPGGGILAISAGNVTLAENNPFSLRPGGYVRLTIEDQGCGIPAADLKKIFDPYFTTKSEGNGLGLASAHSIITRHGGHIAASSVVGTGTVFTIQLPSIGESYPDYLTEAAASTPGSHTGGSILVMDDEEMIRNMTTQMLEFFGYQVMTTADGKEAIAKYKAAREAGTPFAAVIMDLTIPGGMGGREAARHMLEYDPQACLIVSSGYSNDPVMSDFGTHGFAGAVTKPYVIAQLGQLLESLLDQRTANGG